MRVEQTRSNVRSDVRPDSRHSCNAEFRDEAVTARPQLTVPTLTQISALLRPGTIIVSANFLSPLRSHDAPNRDDTAAVTVRAAVNRGWCARVVAGNSGKGDYSQVRSV